MDLPALGPSALVLLATLIDSPSPADLLWRRVLGREAPSSRPHTAVGLATVPLALVASTVALWAALQI